MSLAFGLEQEFEPQRAPTYLGTPPVWPDAGICTTVLSPMAAARAMTTQTPEGEWARHGGPRF